MSDFSAAEVKLLVENFREEIEPVDSEKFEFEDRYNSILLASFGIFGLSKKKATEQKTWFFKGTLLNKITVFGWELDGTSEAHEYREEKV